jgi:hypothetical protein
MNGVHTGARRANRCVPRRRRGHPSRDRLRPNGDRGGNRHHAHSDPTSIARSANMRPAWTQDRARSHPIAAARRPNLDAAHTLSRTRCHPFARARPLTRDLAHTHLRSHFHPTARSHSRFGGPVTHCPRETSPAIRNGDSICPEVRCADRAASPTFPRASAVLRAAGRAFPGATAVFREVTRAFRGASALSREASRTFRRVRSTPREASHAFPDASAVRRAADAPWGAWGRGLSMEPCAFRRGGNPERFWLLSSNVEPDPAGASYAGRSRVSRPRRHPPTAQERVARRYRVQVRSVLRMP